MDDGAVYMLMMVVMAVMVMMAVVVNKTRKTDAIGSKVPYTAV